MIEAVIVLVFVGYLLIGIRAAGALCFAFQYHRPKHPFLEFLFVIILWIFWLPVAASVLLFGD